MKTFEMPIELGGHIEVKANSKEEAIRKYNKLTLAQRLKRVVVTMCEPIPDDEFLEEYTNEV